MIEQKDSGRGSLKSASFVPLWDPTTVSTYESLGLMKIGLISDIHGNSVALRACLDALAECEISRLYFLGDVVGYLPGEADCLEMLRSADARCQQGNHEAMLLQLPIKSIPSDSVYLLEKTSQRLNASVIERLRNWPLVQTVEIDGRRLLLVHGTPDDPIYGRLYPDGDVESAARPGFDAIFMGQTHRPFAAMSANTLIANVGSVGLPRDVGDLSSFGIYDTENCQLSIQRVRFDVEQVLELWGEDVHKSTVACLHRHAPTFVGELRG